MSNRSLRVQEQYIQKANNALISLGLTKREFAETRLQLSRSTVSNCLNGKPVSKENFVRICDVLKLDWEEMAGLKTSSAIDYDATEPATIETDLDGLVKQLREQVKADIETRCGTMRILDMSQPIGLNDIYTKVKILEKISGRRRKKITELIGNCDTENFDRFNFGQVKEKIPGKEAVIKHHTLLILGKPGAGKTTFLKHLAIQCNHGIFQDDLVPFFITLKEFAEAERKPKLLDYLGKYINSNDRDNLNLILGQGKALICLDGLDEVLAADNQQVIKEIESLVHKYPQNQYLMTCRIAAQEYTFTQFTEVEIADFDWKQISIFATNWFQHKPIKPETFLSRLENDKPIQELAFNPLLLTLLCLVFEESSSFSDNRAALYKEGIDALLKKWDAKRGIQRDEIYKKLWNQRKEDLLSKLAWETFSQGEYFFKQDKAERYIGEYIRNLPGANTDEEALRLNSEAVLKSIESQHGLLIERAKGIYSFSHLTFQEYFTAREIILVRQSSDEALTGLVSHLFDPRWREVFLLAVSMSPNAEQLALLMKQEIDFFLVDKPELQDYLVWLNRKTNNEQINFSSEDANIIQDNYKFYASRDLTFSRIFYLNLDLNLNLNLDIDFDFDFCLDIDLDFNLNLNLDIDIDLYFCFYLNLNRNIKLAKEQAPQLYMALLELEQRLPEEEKTSDEEFWEWWKVNGKKWLQDFRTAMIKHRDIGHDWKFNDEQKALLEQYYIANQLLTQCLHQDCYVSPEVRQEIEETLLLPIAEIEKRKNQ